MVEDPQELLLHLAQEQERGVVQMIPPMMDLNPQQVIAVEEVDDNLNVQAEV